MYFVLFLGLNFKLGIIYKPRNSLTQIGVSFTTLRGGREYEGCCGGGGGNLNHIFSSCFPCYKAITLTALMFNDLSISLHCLVLAEQTGTLATFFSIHSLQLNTSSQFTRFNLQKKDLLYFVEKNI